MNSGEGSCCWYRVRVKAALGEWSGIDHRLYMVWWGHDL